MSIIEKIIEQQGENSTVGQVLQQFFPIIEQAEAVLKSQDREDAARLDWIERNARRDPDIGGNHTWWPTAFNKTIRGPSLRKAIDHARRIEGDGE